MKNKIDPSKVKILICCHKQCELPPNPDGIFLPIHVGAAISNVDLHMQRDDQVNGESCDNISAKNGSYCELTAMYWAWKNIKKIYPDIEYIGLNHYRRYFSFDKKYCLDDAIIKPVSNVIEYKLDTKRLFHFLEKGRTLVSKPRLYPYPLFIDYSVCHVSEDIKTLRKIIHEKSPEYDQSFYSVIMRDNALSPYNMTVIGWAEFEQYCEWLFNILFEVEKRIDISKYNPLQKRIFGYMGERLFNIWLHKNCIKTKKLNVYKFDDEKNYVIKNLLRNIRNFLSAWLLKSPYKEIHNWDWLNK